MFDSKAAEIRFLASDGYSAKEIAARVGCSVKYVYATRKREACALTMDQRLTDLFREVGLMRAEFTHFMQELRELLLGVPSIIERRLKQIASLPLDDQKP
jgi:hypothetical protein